MYDEAASDNIIKCHKITTQKQATRFFPTENKYANILNISANNIECCVKWAENNNNNIYSFVTNCEMVIMK